MRIYSMMLCALAASTLDWTGSAHAAPAAPTTSGEQRLGHISIEEVGSGDPVVLIPGLSTPRAVWSQLAPQLAKTHRVLLVQVNGFAGDQPGANLAPGILDGMVEELHRYLADKHIGPVRLIGHSMGGLAGLMLAKAHPADVKSMMVVDSLPYVGDIFVPGATVAQMEPQAKMLRDRMAASYGTADAAGTARTAAGMALTPEAQAKVAAWMTKADARVSAEAMYEDLTTDLRPDAAAIKTPITLVYPTSSAMPKERADGFYRAEYKGVPNVTFVPIADSGHFVMLDQPQAFATAVEQFLK